MPDRPVHGSVPRTWSPPRPMGSSPAPGCSISRGSRRPSHPRAGRPSSRPSIGPRRTTSRSRLTSTCAGGCGPTRRPPRCSGRCLRRSTSCSGASRRGSSSAVRRRMPGRASSRQPSSGRGPAMPCSSSARTVPRRSARTGHGRSHRRYRGSRSWIRWVPATRSVPATSRGTWRAWTSPTRWPSATPAARPWSRSRATRQARRPARRRAGSDGRSGPGDPLTGGQPGAAVASTSSASPAGTGAPARNAETIVAVASKASQNTMWPTSIVRTVSRPPRSRSRADRSAGMT